ncbi:unnamed protein product [Urochloa decumbens]|uniref:Protein kinase domain-containing protein n=1 Tax=Urochloa decumbens TaxID=240449 RepID=A0ABC9AVH0_9POAL
MDFIVDALVQAISRDIVAACDSYFRQCEATFFRAAYVEAQKYMVSKSIITLGERFGSPEEEHRTPAMLAADYSERTVLAETKYRILCLEQMMKENLGKYLSDEYHGLNWQSRFNIVKRMCMFLEDLDRQLKPANIYLNRNMMPKLTDFGLPMSCLGTQVNIPVGTDVVKYFGSLGSSYGFLADMIHRLLCFEYVPMGNLGMYLSDGYRGFDWPRRYNMDLKPGNVLLHENIVPKITDFGLARCFGEERMQIMGDSIGTRGYIDPEYLHTRNIVSNKSDVYSFGVILLEMLTRKAGYSKRSEMSSEEFTEIEILNSANGAMNASTSILERTRGESTYVRLTGFSLSRAEDVEDDFYLPFVLDSGASMHIVGDSRMLQSYRSLPEPYTTITMANDRYHLKIVGKGTIKWGSFIIPNVPHVEGLDSILISIGQLDRDHKLSSFCSENWLCLSYADLATQLKQCYLHCALFPKGTVTTRDAVIKMWIRERFIQPPGSSHDDDRLENVVMEYYLGLIKSLIQLEEKYSLTGGMCIFHDVVRSFAAYMAREEIPNISSCLETGKSTEDTSTTVSPIQQAVLVLDFISAVIVTVYIIALSMVLVLDSSGSALAAAASMHQHLYQSNLTDERSDKPRSNTAPQTNSSDDTTRAPMANKLTDNEAENHSDPNSCIAEHDTIEKAKRSGEWYVATGAAHHATGNPDLITNMLELENGVLYVHAADGSPMPVRGRGNVMTDAVVLPDVYYVPGLCTNLVSVGQLAGLDYSVGFGRGTCIVSSPDGTVVGGAHARGDGLYEVDFLRVSLDML